MKNIFKIGAVALAVTFFAACDPKPTTTETEKIDTVKTDTAVKVDTVKADTAKTDSVKK